MNYDAVDMRSIPRTILDAINGLDQPISLAIDCYVHTLDSQLDINTISCLESLRVCLVNIPHFSNHRGLSHESFEDNISTGVAEIIHQNPRMKALHLCLQNGRSAPFIHESYQEVRELALEEIGRTVPQLDSLALEGDLLFNEVAWKTWNTTCGWSHLRSLSITNMSLIETVIGRLKGHLPALRRLKLSAYGKSDCFPHNEFYEGADSMKAFLSGLNLTHLSMLGFHPDVLLSNMEPVGSLLQNIRFHIRENPTDLIIVRGPTFSTLLLSAERIALLKNRCTNIRWIGFDVPRSSLKGADDEPASSVPQRQSVLAMLVFELTSLLLLALGNSPILRNGLHKHRGPASFHLYSPPMETLPSSPHEQIQCFSRPSGANLLSLSMRCQLRLSQFLTLSQVYPHCATSGFLFITIIMTLGICQTLTRSRPSSIYGAASADVH